MVFMNTSGTVYTIIEGMNALTGGLFVTLLMIFFLLLLICVVLRIPMEMTGAFLLPFCIVAWAQTGNFLAVTGVLLIYLGVVVAKNLPIGN